LVDNPLGFCLCADDYLCTVDSEAGADMNDNETFAVTILGVIIVVSIFLGWLAVREQDTQIEIAKIQAGCKP
jgi:hypothetical protein